MSCYVQKCGAPVKKKHVCGGFVQTDDLFSRLGDLCDSVRTYLCILLPSLRDADRQDKNNQRKVQLHLFGFVMWLSLTGWTPSVQLLAIQWYPMIYPWWYWNIHTQMCSIRDITFLQIQIQYKFTRVLLILKVNLKNSSWNDVTVTFD